MSVRRHFQICHRRSPCNYVQIRIWAHLVSDGLFCRPSQKKLILSLLNPNNSYILTISSIIIHPIVLKVTEWPYIETRHRLVSTLVIQHYFTTPIFHWSKLSIFPNPFASWCLRGKIIGCKGVKTPRINSISDVQTELQISGFTLNHQS